MKNTFGNTITVTIFGESHGQAIGAVLDGIAPGVKIDEEYIRRQMNKRRAAGKISTGRQEGDVPVFLSGVKDGRTEGTPIAILITNENVRRRDYSELKDIARPGHADYAGHVKYAGFEDASGGGHFSGRITAPLTAAGAVCQCMLEELGIFIGSHIASLNDIQDDSFDEANLEAQIRELNDALFPVLNKETGDAMVRRIEEARDAMDSVGGILDTAVTGLPAGLGEPFFDSAESRIAHAVFSVPAVKGIEFGKGFAFAEMNGSEANDPFRMKDGRVVTSTNNNGGINGGITNGMPVRFRTVIKPTPSIARPQQTVNYETGEEKEITISGRHDPAIIHRARVVVDSVTAIVIADMLAERYGTTFFQGERG